MAIINSETGCEEWWYLDTGCSNHMTGHKDWFCELDETVRRSIKFGDGRTVMAKGIGRVSIRRVDGSKVVMRNLNTFEWSSSDMPRIDPDFLCHKLALNPSAKSIIQKRRKFGEEKIKAITEEIDKLIFANHVREIHYLSW